MDSLVDNLGRCPDQASILLIGSTGAGKSATINHLLSTAKLNERAKIGSSKPETRVTSEFVVTVEDHNNDEHSKLTLGIIDTPGFNDRSDVKQDSYNSFSIKHFFLTHPKYKGYYPNLIFLLVSTNDDRIEGSNSDLANTLRALKDLGVVDQRRPNIVAVLTHCCSVSDKNLSKWEAAMQEKKEIISRNICQALGIHEAPVVLLENSHDDLELERKGDFTLLPNEESQPKNLYNACEKLLEKNEDRYGLIAFEACLVDPKTKKHCEVARHKVIAKDASDSKSGNQLSGSTTYLLGGSDRNGRRHYRMAGAGLVGVVFVIVLIVVIVLATRSRDRKTR